MFYGWVIVAFTLVLQFVCVGTAYYTFGVYLVPLTEALQTDRFSVSLALSMQTLVMAFMGPWVGRMVARHSLRGLLIGGVLLASAGLFGMSMATRLWHVYVSFGLLVSVGMAMTGPLPNNTLLANWFVHRRGTALGISQFGVTISGTVLVPATTWLILEFGWRTSYLVYAIALPLLLIPAIVLFAVKHPEDRGLHPDGDPDPQPLPPPDAAGDWTLGRALRDRQVWLLALVVGPCFMAISAVVLALPSHGTDLGLTPLQASSVVALTTLLGALAKPLFGTLTDYFDSRRVLAIALGCQIAGIGVLTAATTYPSLVVAGLLFGLGYGAIAPLWAVLLAELFGREAFARVMGSMMPLVMPFSLLGLPVTTLAFELTGSYSPAFYALFLAYALATGALFMLRVPPKAIVAPGG